MNISSAILPQGAGTGATTPASVVQHLERVEALVSQIPSRVIVQYASAYRLDSETARRHFTELVKFLVICSISAQRCAPSEMVDGVWHHFVMFTREYREFCLNHLGKFVDHDPSPREANIAAYLFTRQTLSTNDPRFDPTFWPLGKQGATMCGATMCGASRPT